LRVLRDSPTFREKTLKRRESLADCAKLTWKLKNGQNPLPLDADEFTMKKASVEQLRDLSARRGEGKQQFRQGWHSAGSSRR
jgi:hypothetical protein